MTAVPFNPEAEESTLGAMLINDDALRIGLEMCRAEDFHDLRNSKAFAAIEDLFRRGGAIDVSTVAEELLRGGGEVGEHRVRLLEMSSNVVSVRHIEDYATTVVRHATARRLLGLCSETSQRLLEMADPYEAADGLAADLALIDAPLDQSKVESLTIDELLLTAEDDSPWVVPGMLRQDWRVVLVAGEGIGKSVILRQIAMMTAQGIHPFRHNKIRPVRTLIVDFENPTAAIAETAGRIRTHLQQHVPEYDPGACRVFSRPGGVDVRIRHGRGELEREIRAQKPDLVCIGPIYKMLRPRGHESFEQATDPVLEILDDFRTRHHFALMIEHHAPQGASHQREMRPYGSQRWLAWPDIGLSLSVDQKATNTWNLGRFRGDRMVTQWPDSLHRGAPWPWVGRWTQGLEEF